MSFAVGAAWLGSYPGRGNRSRDRDHGTGLVKLVSRCRAGLIQGLAEETPEPVPRPIYGNQHTQLDRADVRAARPGQGHVIELEF